MERVGAKASEGSALSLSITMVSDPSMTVPGPVDIANIAMVNFLTLKYVGWVSVRPAESSWHG